MQRRYFSKCLGITLAATLIWAADRLPETTLITQAQADEIVLQAVRPFPYDHPFSVTHRELIERVNERMAGRLRIEDVGGGEVFPVFEQLEPVIAGQIQLLNTPASYLLDRFPEGQANYLTFGARPEEKAELIRVLDEIARERLGIAIIGAPSHYRFHVYTSREVSDLDDLKELRIRVSPTYLPTLRALDVPTVTMPAGDAYLALDRGVIDGLAWPDFGVVDWGWHEHLRYQIYPPLWEVGDHLVYMHAATLDGLPDDVREEFLAIVGEVDSKAYDLFNQFAEEELAELRDAGIQPVEISEDVWRGVQEIQWNEALAELRGVAPENADRLEEIVRQWYPPAEVYQPPFDWR